MWKPAAGTIPSKREPRQRNERGSLASVNQTQHPGFVHRPRRGHLCLNSPIRLAAPQPRRASTVQTARNTRRGDALGRRQRLPKSNAMPQPFTSASLSSTMRPALASHLSKRLRLRSTDEAPDNPKSASRRETIVTNRTTRPPAADPEPHPQSAPSIIPTFLQTNRSVHRKAPLSW